MEKIKLASLQVSVGYEKYVSMETQVTDEELKGMYALLEELPNLSSLKIQVSPTFSIYLYPQQLKKAVAGINVREVEVKVKENKEDNENKDAE